MTPEQISCLESENCQLKRDLSLAQKTSEGLQAELGNALTEGLRQIQAVHAVACGIFGMTKLAKARLMRKLVTSRILHREYQDYGNALRDLILTVEGKGGFPETAMANAKEVMTRLNKSSEVEKAELLEAALFAGINETHELLAYTHKAYGC